jgi:hypothetical protein
VVSVFVTGPNRRGFKPGRSDGFLMAITIRSTPPFGWEVKPEVPCRKLLRLVKEPRDVTQAKFNDISRQLLESLLDVFGAARVHWWLNKGY